MNNLSLSLQLRLLFVWIVLGTRNPLSGNQRYWTSPCCVLAQQAQAAAFPTTPTSGILKRVTERLDVILNLPVQAVRVLDTFHANQGFRPNGLHAAGRDRALTFLFSLIQSFDGLKIYLGTERGEYLAMFETEAVYREPGNSGYAPDDPEDERSIYWPVCISADNEGQPENCTMAPGATYVQCVNDCELVPCPGGGSNDAKTWCSNYTIQQVKEDQTLGFVPASYHCFNQYGLFSQEPGQVRQSTSTEPPDGGPILSTSNNGTCYYGYGDGAKKPVTRVTSGPFAYCGGGGETCNGTYAGGLRTIDYDPRMRPWYVDTKRIQQATWSAPYPFVTHSNIVAKVGITYAHPYYINIRNTMESESELGDNGDDRTVFAGVFAVDYTLDDISKFLTATYGFDAQDVVVTVIEPTEPFFLIGSSTGIYPYQKVQAENESVRCAEFDEDCVTVRVSAVEMDSWDDGEPERNRIASRSVQAQVAAGFPENNAVTVKATDNDVFSKGFLCQSLKYQQTSTSLKWVVVVSSPMVLDDSDSIQVGSVLFITLILVSVAGAIACGTLFALWYRNREKRAVKHGDFLFTSAFILGCTLLNLSSLASLGENTDAMCLTRYWTFNMSLSLILAPLLAKVYRVYLLVGGGCRRREVTAKQTALYMLPIISVDMLILLIFTFVDPPRTVEEIDFDSSVPVQHFRCEHQSVAAVVTEMVYTSTLVAVGCILSYLSRNLDSRFGEAKQLLFGMYNIAVTGLCLMFLLMFMDVTPDAIAMFRTIGIFWGTVLTCAVFVIPRLIQAWNPMTFGQRSSIRLSGLDLSGHLATQKSEGNLAMPKSPAKLEAQHNKDDPEEVTSSRSSS